MVYRDSSGRFAKMPVTTIEEQSWYLVCALQEALPKKRLPYINGDTVVAKFPGGSWQLVKDPRRNPEGAVTISLFAKLTQRERYDCKLALVATGQL